jgi:hypothetical protein
MRSKFPSLLILFVVLAFGQKTFGSTNSETLALKAVSTDTSESARAIAELRTLGPAGLAALFNVHKEEIHRQVSNPLLPASSEWQRLSAALDAVSRQKDSYLSGLYWYTDLSQAQKVARAAGKPILSLRLLGNLNEEFSCANSRFFRTILYSNVEVSQMLREKFILHWKSVRRAPHITIDFGDGRKLERTVTGNSIHYILDADGRPIDALPGLYGPKAFLGALDEAEAVFQQLARPGGTNLIQALSAYHNTRLRLINLAWVADIEMTGGKIPQSFNVVRAKDGTPLAIEVAPLAMTKMVTEITMLRSMTAGSEALGKVTDEALWKRIAALHMNDARLDSRSIGLIQRQTHKALLADLTKTSPEAALRDLIKKLEMHIALDTMRNEYLLHTKLHEWLITDRLRSDLDAFNDKVYAELFLTPASDPWLGLLESSTYVALENGGIVR